jgi:hypothetical protein
MNSMMLLLVVQFIPMQTPKVFQAKSLSSLNNHITTLTAWQPGSQDHMQYVGKKLIDHHEHPESGLASWDAMQC